MTSPDIVIIGSGIGGATVASGLAGSGAKILILERGEHLADTPETRDSRAIFRAAISGRRRCGTRPAARRSIPATTTMSAAIRNSTARCWCATAREDFLRAGALRRRLAGLADLLRGTGALVFAGRAALPGARRARRRPDRAVPFAALCLPAGAGRAGDRRARAELQGLGLHPCLAAARHRHRRLADGRQDALGRLSQHRIDGKMDAETGPLATALADANVTLQTGAHVDYLELSADGKRSPPSTTATTAQSLRMSPKLVILSCRRDQLGGHPAAFALDRTARGSPTVPIRSAATS